MKLFPNFKHFMRHAGFVQTTYSDKQTDRQVPFGPLSLALFRIYSEKKKYIFSFTAKVHVCLSKFGDRLPEKENPKRKRDKPALCNRCVL